MIPLSLRLRNFMSYGLDGGELDLRSIHMACLSGGNGNGKSALIDAITWALWGRSRAGREDDLIRMGSSDMEVEFEFACGGAVYRVIRKRVVRKSTSTALLELAVRDGDTYRAITGHTVPDTERAISDLLRLSYDTFINSSLLLQGKADLFTTKKPGERKEMLAEILGVSRYEALAVAARARERDHETEQERHTLRLAELERFIEGIPALHQSLAAAETALEAVRTARAASEVAVTDLAARLRVMEGIRESVARLEARLATIEREEAQARRALAAVAARRAAAERLLAAEPAIQERLALLAAARRENDRLAALLGTLRALDARVHAAKSAIDAEAHALDRERVLAERSLREAREAERTLEQKLPELVRVQAAVGALPGALEAREALTGEAQILGEEISALKATNTILEGQRNAMRKRIESLKAAGADCPTCGAPLSEERRKETHAAAMAEGLRCKGEMEANAARGAALGTEQQALGGRVRVQDAEIARLQGLCRKEGELTQAISALHEKCAGLPALRAEEERLRTLIEAEAFALDQRAALEALHAEIALLGYDAASHAALGAQIEELRVAEQERAALDAARESLARIGVEIAAGEARLHALAEERERLLAERAPLLEQTAGGEALRADLEERRRELEERRRQEGAVQETMGGLRRQIADGDACVRERATVAAACAEAGNQAWAHKELADIFGKRGIQAMLIENALPELEQDANELLARMTNNTTQVQFLTQRQGTGGKIVETLEIKIADEMGTRAYELFSGGEAFRINFAIRIALSKLLARRAGAELSFLMIDEGFGSQDNIGRDRLVEAIGSIADDFEKILVVTHIEDLKDQFDVHIDVSKGLSGSQITISAA